MSGDLSELSEAQPRDLLQVVRRIASLDDTAALAEIDNLAWSISEMIARSREALGGGDWLERSAAEGEARFRETLAAAHADLEHPNRIGPFDGTRLRHLAVLAEDDDRQQTLTMADEIDVAYAGAQLERALTEPIGSTASLPKHFRAIDHAVAELEKRGRLTPELGQRARAAKERLARFRAQKKLDEAEVADAGGNAKKATKLRAEAGAVLAQDWPRAFPGEKAPPA
jgi:hypothetical protein